MGGRKHGIGRDDAVSVFSLKGEGATADHLELPSLTLDKIKIPAQKYFTLRAIRAVQLFRKALAKREAFQPIEEWCGLRMVQKNAVFIPNAMPFFSMMSRKVIPSPILILGITPRLFLMKPVWGGFLQTIFLPSFSWTFRRTSTLYLSKWILEPITRELPLEYAVEMNRLIELEMEGSVG